MGYDTIEEQDQLDNIDNEHDDYTSDDTSENDPQLNKVKLAATAVAGSVSSVVKRALQSREHVLMVRINDEALNRINDLKDAGLFRSRSEAAAYLIAEGIERKEELFTRIQEKIRQIQEIKYELQALAGDVENEPKNEPKKESE